MKIFKEKAGVISKEPVWVCLHDCYMYTGDTFIGLLWNMVKYWNDDKMMIWLKFMELNPNHKVVRQAHDNWHKIAALIMLKLNLTELQITPDDLKKIAAGNVNIVLDARGERKTGCLTVRIIDDKTADELARQEGGRPIDN